MTRTPDRLSDIWSRFGRGTSARLSGASVEGTVRPSASDAPRYRAPDAALAEAVRGPDAAGTPDPVAAASQALRASMTAKRSRRAAPAPSAPDDLIAAQVLADMKATEARVARRQTDYLAYAASMQAGGRKKRRLFGIF